MIEIIAYFIIFLSVAVIINSVSEEMLRSGEPHNLENIDIFGFKVTVVTYLIISIAVTYLAYKIYEAQKYVVDVNERRVLSHYRNAFFFTGLSHILEFFGALYLYVFTSGSTPIILFNMKFYLYPVLVVLGYIALCFSTVELFLAIYYAIGYETSKPLIVFLIFPDGGHN